MYVWTLLVDILVISGLLIGNVSESAVRSVDDEGMILCI